MAIRLDPAKAAGQSMVINWHFTDRDEKLALTLAHCTLTHRLGEWSDKATASVITTRDTLDANGLGQAHRAASDGVGHAQGRRRSSRLAALFAMLDSPDRPDVRHPDAW